jgi:DNA-binding transcriptional LysR family regulator
VATDAVSDLVEDGFEAAIRLGTPSSPDLVARPLQPYRLVLCASPAYLEANGVPASPEALRAHQCLTYAYPPRSEMRAVQPEWVLSGARGPVSVPVGGRLKIDSADALRRAILAGMGIAMLPSILVDADIEAGRLVRVLPDEAPPARPINLLYLRDRQMSPKLRSFVDFVIERFGAVSDQKG